MENNALNNFNQAAAATTSEEKKKNNVYLNLKVTTKSGDVRRFSFLLCNSGSGIEQSNANAVIDNALACAGLPYTDEPDLNKANAYLNTWFANPALWTEGRIEGSCYLSGIKSANKDWVNDI